MAPRTIRFGDSNNAGSFPTEEEFRKSVGTNGFKRHVIRSSSQLHEIYKALRRARSQPNDRSAMRNLRKACASWVMKRGVGMYSTETAPRLQKPIVELGMKAHNRYYLLVNRFYNDTGKQDQLDRKIIGAKIRDGIQTKGTGQTVGKALDDAYRMERHTKKHVSNHIVSENDWNQFKTEHNSRIGFEDWVELVCIPDREDRVINLDHKRRYGTAELLRNGVQYLTENQRDKFRLTCGQGGKVTYLRQTVALAERDNPLPPRIVNTAGMGGNTGPCFGIFVIDFDHEIYVGRPSSSQFHHSSFLSGAPAYAAGEIAIQHGTVRGVSNKTGHYKAGQIELYRTLCVLRAMGVTLTNTLAQDRSLRGDRTWRKATDVLRYHGKFNDPGFLRTPTHSMPVF